MVAEGSRRFLPLAAALASGWIGALGAQSVPAYEADAVELDHPAIAYRAAPRADAAVQLNRRLGAGTATLTLDGESGYLRSLLAQLDVPVESQIAVYSKTSLQSSRIHPRNPRTIFFNDNVAVAWMRSGFIEVAAHDPVYGAGFYLLPQSPLPVPQLIRDNSCLGCHFSAGAEGVPGFLSRSIPTAADGAPLPWLGNANMDHRTPLRERWGGWYVTGNSASPHLGNLILPDRRTQELPAWNPSQTLNSLSERFDTGGYLSEHSDIVALLVFEHQTRVMNLLTRTGWLARLASADATPARHAHLAASVSELVDSLLFVDEAPLEDVRGSSGYATVFSAPGPRDGLGRSLRELDLTKRLMRYPCSYMVYSAAFDGLPDQAREMVYRRMKRILSGDERAARYAHAAAGGATVLDILRATKQNMPGWF